MNDAASKQFEAASFAFDEANSADPRVLRVRGKDRPFALGEAELATLWLDTLEPDASEPLRLAVRAHHLRRWETPRASYPDGRAGYLKWRKHLYDVAFDNAAAIMRTTGYDEQTVARVGELMHKADLGGDPEAQAYEDVLCLVFLESQFNEFASRTDPDKLQRIVTKTLAKMSDRAKAAWEEFQQ